MSRTSSRLALSALLCAAFAAVAAEDPDTGDAGQVPISLDGKPWTLAAYRSSGKLTEISAQSRPTVFRFGEGQVSGVIGCNRVTGGFTIDDQQRVFPEALASTQMACPPPLMQQEADILDALARAASYRGGDDRIELLDAQGEVLLQLQRPASPTIAAQTWRLIELEGTTDVPAAATSRSAITLRLDGYGKVSGFDGCNRYLSGYTLAEDRLAIGPIATTRMACRAGKPASDVATAYAAALAKVAHFQSSGGELTLLDADQRPIARFAPDDAAP